MNGVYRRSSEVDIGHVYLLSYYWTTLAMTTIGNLPHPRQHI